MYTAQTGGDELGSVVFRDMVLTKGLFKVELDFGHIVFGTHGNWLEVAVRPGGSMDPYTVLSPRQRLTPVPYAIFAQAESWSLIGVPVGFTSGREKGMITTDRIADDAVTGAKIASDQVVKGPGPLKNDVSPPTESNAARALAATPGRIAKFDTPTTLVDSIMFEGGGNIGIGTTTPGAQLHVSSVVHPVPIGRPLPDVTQVAVSRVFDSPIQRSPSKEETDFRAPNKTYFGEV